MTLVKITVTCMAINAAFRSGQCGLSNTECFGHFYINFVQGALILMNVHFTSRDRNAIQYTRLGSVLAYSLDQGFSTFSAGGTPGNATDTNRTDNREKY